MSGIISISSTSSKKFSSRLTCWKTFTPAFLIWNWGITEMYGIVSKVSGEIGTSFPELRKIIRGGDFSHALDILSILIITVVDLCYKGSSGRKACLLSEFLPFLPKSQISNTVFLIFCVCQGLVGISGNAHGAHGTKWQILQQQTFIHWSIALSWYRWSPLQSKSIVTNVNCV